MNKYLLAFSFKIQSVNENTLVVEFWNDFLKTDFVGGGELTQMFSALTAFPEEMGSVSSIHIAIDN